MKILITVSTYYPLKDGVSRVTQYLAEGLSKRGHSVLVITSNEQEKKENEIHNGVNIKRINLFTKYGLYFGDKKDYKKIINEEANHSDVMINVCTQNAFTDVILKQIDNYKCKKILYLHGIFDFKFHKLDFSSFAGTINKLWKEIRWFFYYLLNGKYFKKYNHITQLHEKDYGNIFFERKYDIKSTIIENGADNDFFEKKVERDFKKPFNKYLISVANYDDRKNQKMAIEEFLKSNIDNNIGFVFIGSQKNSYYHELERTIRRLRIKYNLSNNQKPILLLHNIDRKYVSSYVSNSLLYIMTSKWEAYPISIIEAMSCGVPYISTDVGIVRYFSGGVVTNKKDFGYWLKILTSQEDIRNECLSKDNFIEYYYTKDGGISYYQCDGDQQNKEHITNCQKCYFDKNSSKKLNCYACKDGYFILNYESDFCYPKDSIINNGEYIYINSTHMVYCANLIINCDKCTSAQNCIKCIHNFFYLNNKKDRCFSRSELQPRDEFYNEGDYEYFSCNNSNVHSISNCKKCLSKYDCLLCEDNYTFINGNKYSCIEINSLQNKYYKDPNDESNYISCSNLLDNCNICNNTQCLKCDEEYIFIDDDTRLS